MPTPWTIHRLPPQRLWYAGMEPRLGPWWGDKSGRPQCEAVVSGLSTPYAVSYFNRCSWAAKANGFCRTHQHLARKGFGMDFYVIVAENHEPLPELFGSLDEAKATAESLARKTGELIYICKPILKAATHEVDWSDVVESEA